MHGRKNIKQLSCLHACGTDYEWRFKIFLGKATTVRRTQITSHFTEKIKDFINGLVNSPESSTSL